MKNIFKYVKQLFDAPANMTGTNDIDTEVRLIDFVTSFQKNIQALLDILGISRLIRKENGTELKVRKVSGVLQSGDVAEGDEIPASEYKVQERRLGKIKLKKYKKIVSIEAIADKGYDACVEARPRSRLLLHTPLACARTSSRRCTRRQPGLLCGSTPWTCMTTWAMQP